MKYLKYKRVWKVPWECSFFSVSLFKSPLDFGVMAKTIANPPNGDIYRYKRSDSYMGYMKKLDLCLFRGECLAGILLPLTKREKCLP